MKKTQQKGFSLAEVLISLTVVSIMLAAAAPVFTKHSVGDNTWRWTQDSNVKNGTSFNGNSVVIGSRSIPYKSELFNSVYFPDTTVSSDIRNAVDTAMSTYHADRINSKLSILKNNNDFSGSHISFYNIVNSRNDYVGRLTADRSNLALGIASLQKLTPDYANNRGIYNTAIGHYALANNTEGTNNVALGYKALFSNTENNRNTAIGHKAGVLADNGNNTIVGNHIDTVVDRIEGSDNLIIGNYTNSYEGYPTDGRRWGGNNIFIGNNAGRGLPDYFADANGKYSNVLAIGNVDFSGSVKEGQKVELLQANLTQPIMVSSDEDKKNRKLVVNGDFVIRSADGTRTLFKVDGSGTPINLYNDPYGRRYASIFEGFPDEANNNSAGNGPARCEGAEVCIANFTTPSISNSQYGGAHNKYDIYIKGMVGTRKWGNNSLLGDVLFMLDRAKDSQGVLLRLFASLSPTKVGNGLFNSKIFSGISSFFNDLFGIGSSDARLKDIYGDSTAGLKEINALKIKNYTYKADKIKTPHVGVIAQELQKVFPNSVIEGDDGYLRITQEEMFYGLVNSIQELSDKNDKVSEKIALSKQQVEYTKQQNKLIEQENKLLEKQNKEFAKRIAKMKSK